MKFTLNQTCAACPEQYDVFLGEDTNRLIGYIRLRFGELSVYYPSIDGELVYTHDFGDRLQGSFNNDKEREDYINIALNTIKNKIIEETFGNVDNIEYVVK